MVGSRPEEGNDLKLEVLHLEALCEEGVRNSMFVWMISSY